MTNTPLTPPTTPGAGSWGPGWVSWGTDGSIGNWHHAKDAVKLAKLPDSRQTANNINYSYFDGCCPWSATRADTATPMLAAIEIAVPFSAMKFRSRRSSP